MPLRQPSWLSANLISLCIAGCAGSVPPPAVADPIRLDKAPPPPGAEPLRGLRATDGHGCGLFTSLGTYEGASANLREQAKALGADYVQITEVKEPYADRECVHKEYTLVGIAYRSAAAPKPSAVVPSAASVTTAASATTAACASGRMLEFSARSPTSAAFGVWFDQATNTAPGGLELRYEPSKHELSLVRYPDAKAVAVADDPVDLGSDWHAFRLERSADKVSVWIDGKLVLLHAAADPGATASFALDAEGIELRGMRLGCADAPKH